MAQNGNVTLTEDQLAGIVAGAVTQALENLGSAQVAARKAGPPREIKVHTNEGAEARKYGDVTIAKANEDGTYIPRVGIRKADLPGLIKDLQAANRALRA